MNHRQVRDLLPEFALGALELQEQEELLQHLRSCSSCYLLAQEHMEVAEILASGIAEVEPPAELKGMIEDSVADQPKPLETRIRGTGPSFLDRLGLTPNPPKDTDGRREDSGRGWVRELQGRWPGLLG